jgi:hypothetical protein
MATAQAEKGQKTAAVRDCIKQIAKETPKSVREITHKECNKLLKHKYGFTVSDPLFYAARKSLEGAVKCSRCDESFESPIKLAQHARKEHPKPKPKKAKLAPARFGVGPVNDQNTIQIEELPNLLQKARDLVSYLGNKDSAKKFIDVVV